ncbi:MAG TPA: ATP-dependent protease, Lon family [Firmicutes bacterium]|nr:ATP-dependent protease, Lon family [Candidatus Fermentithermobacillaceae bacterium]
MKDMVGKLDMEEFLKRQVGAMFSFLASIYGPEKLVLKAGRLDALSGMRSRDLAQQVAALQKVVFEDPTIQAPDKLEAIPGILEECQEEIAERMARQAIEQDIEERVSRRMQEKHDEYIQDIRREVLMEDGDPETEETRKKLNRLVKLEERSIARSALYYLRPRRLTDIVGQDRAIRALLSKLATPYPQHVILYGPPGVGKTSAARLVLEEARKLSFSPFAKDAPFVETDGATLRWDPREITNPLLGSVHDPIYQGARRDLADIGVPEPKLGLVTEATGGILFIDEIGEMDPILQNKLLKVLEDKRVVFDSSYYDPTDKRVPEYVRRLFEKGAPADFILVGATTRDPEEISPALRSRAAEVFFDALTPQHIAEIVKGAARRLRAKLTPEAVEVITDYTVEGRKAVGLLADAYAVALHRQGGLPYRGFLRVEAGDVKDAIGAGRLSPNVTTKASDKPAVGKVFGLGVASFLGSTLEIEAVAFDAREKGKGSIRMNETAGSMVKDSLFNASTSLRKELGIDLADKDVHVNIVGGAKVDGPSAGLAITLAIFSAVTGIPVRQDVAVTGEISLTGEVKAIGGVYEKIYGAKQAGMKMILVPKANSVGVEGVRGIQIGFVSSLKEALDFACPDWQKAVKSA